VSLTIVDTPGFGDQIDNESAFGEIVGYLERQYDDILAVESRIKRNPRFPDNRIHALLYFITPTGHGLRELDIELMKRLSPRANVIPVIGKADCLTPAELAESKKLIMEDIEHYRIPVYNFPYDVEEDDEDTVEENAELRGLMPFAIVGSEDVLEINNRRVRARQYPWGVVEVENPRHSDFLAIRSALLHSHLADLKEITHDFLYENYRTEKLSKSVDGGIGEYVEPNSSALDSVWLTFFTVTKIRQSTPRTLPSNLCVSRKSSSAVKRRNSARSKSRSSVRSTRNDRSCWPVRANCARSRPACSASTVLLMMPMAVPSASRALSTDSDDNA
jgi:cell division control protein 11